MSSVFRPRSAAEIADAAIQLVRQHFRAFLLLAAVTAIPNLLIGFAVAHLAPSLATPTGTPDPDDFVTLFGWTAVAMAFWLVSLAAQVSMASDVYRGRHPDPATSLRAGLRHAVAVIVGNLLAYLFAGLAALVLTFAAGLVAALLTLPFQGAPVVAIVMTVVVTVGVLVGAIVIFARYLVLTPAVVVEGLGPMQAIRRSAELSKGLLLRNAGLAVIMGFLLGAVSVAAVLIAGAVIPHQQTANALAGLVVIPLYPVVACLLAVLYYDLRIRKEGYDLELMTQALQGEAGGAAEAPPAAPAF